MDILRAAAVLPNIAQPALRDITNVRDNTNQSVASGVQAPEADQDLTPYHDIS